MIRMIERDWTPTSSKRNKDGRTMGIKDEEISFNSAFLCVRLLYILFDPNKHSVDS